MEFLNRLLGRGKKTDGNVAGDASRGDSMQEPKGKAEPPAPAEPPAAAEPEKEAES